MGAGRQDGQAADHRAADPDHRRRACRSGTWLGRGQDHAGPRLQRLSKSASAPGSKPGEMLNMFDAAARVVQTTDGLIPEELLGLDRLRRAQARGRVARSRRRAGKVEDRAIQTPYGDRSGVVIEPWLTDQWYVDAATLAKPAIEAARSGAIKIVPETWAKTWFNWLENIQPWCVSRQLWWGHRIPAWQWSTRDAGGQPEAGVRIEMRADGGANLYATHDQGLRGGRPKTRQLN